MTQDEVGGSVFSVSGGVLTQDEVGLKRFQRKWVLTQDEVGGEMFSVEVGGVVTEIKKPAKQLARRLLGIKNLLFLQRTSFASKTSTELLNTTCFNNTCLCTRVEWVRF